VGADPSFDALSGGVIGRAGQIPWHYPGDLRRFKRVTRGSAVVMGRKTWESIGRPLPERRNVVITKNPASSTAGVETFPTLDAALAALAATEPDRAVWFIGGAAVYAAALPLVDVLDVTFVPESISAEGSVRFPPVDPRAFRAGPLMVHEDDPRLRRREFTAAR
jgi:dihydrofolate reductase